MVTLSTSKPSFSLDVLFKMTKWSTYLGPPALAIASGTLFRGLIVFERFCVVHFTFEINVVFVFMDTLLSALYLILFLVPFMQFGTDAHRSITPGPQRKKLMQAAKKNLRLSLIQIASTLIVNITVVMLQFSCLTMNLLGQHFFVRLESPLMLLMFLSIRVHSISSQISGNGTNTMSEEEE